MPTQDDMKKDLMAKIVGDGGSFRAITEAPSAATKLSLADAELDQGALEAAYEAFNTRMTVEGGLVEAINAYLTALKVPAGCSECHQAPMNRLEGLV